MIYDTKGTIINFNDIIFLEVLQKDNQIIITDVFNML